MIVHYDAATPPGGTQTGNETPLIVKNTGHTAQIFRAAAANRRRCTGGNVMDSEN